MPDQLRELGTAPRAIDPRPRNLVKSLRPARGAIEPIRYPLPSQSLHGGRIADRSPPPPSLPSDSDEAALDAIAASGKPLTLPEAIETAFRFQPRLRAQLETISQARGLQQIAFSAFLPTVAGNYDVGGYSLGVGGHTHPTRQGFAGIQLHTQSGSRSFRLQPRDDF